MFLPKSKEDAVAKRTPPPASTDGWFGTRCPALLEYLLQDHYENGDKRETSTITVFSGPQGLQACLNDRDGGRVAFVTGGTVEAILEALEAGLQMGDLDWRLARQQPRKK